MGILAAVLLVVWGIGIVTNLVGIVQVAKDETHPLYDQMQMALDTRPGLYLGILSVLTVFWPATLVYSLIKKRN